jgi:hypothetical protein
MHTAIQIRETADPQTGEVLLGPSIMGRSWAAYFGVSCWGVLFADDLSERGKLAVLSHDALVQRNYGETLTALQVYDAQPSFPNKPAARDALDEAVELEYLLNDNPGERHTGRYRPHSIQRATRRSISPDVP